MDYLLFTEQDILERVDEYTLYCFYLGFEPIVGAKYICPAGIRTSNNLKIDTDPSFGIFERKKGGSHLPHEFLWKDGAAGKTGDIFDLVQRVRLLKTRREAMLDICARSKLGGEVSEGDILTRVIEPVYMDPIDIVVCSKPFTKRDLTFWGQGNINLELLQRYYVTVIKHYWLAKDQKIPSYPKGLGYAYREYDKYQLYFPNAEKKNKFRNNFTEVCVHGYRQLTEQNDLLIITKSRKDVMVLRSFGYDAIAPRSEHTMLPELCIEAVNRKYKRKLILFDNDGKHNGDKYSWDKVFVPLVRPDDKDPFDFCRNHGSQETAVMLKTIFGL